MMADLVNHHVIGVSVAMIVLAVFFTIIRFWSRALQKPGRRFWWDDCFALLLLILSLVISALQIAWAQIGLGKHTIEVVETDPAYLELSLKYLFWGSFVYEFGISAAKFAALFFYIRVFGLKDGKLWWKAAIYSCFALSVAWIIFSMFLTIFQCTPVSGAWNKTTTPAPSCITPYSFFVSNNVTNFINDILIVLIPIPRVFQLQMRTTKKILVAAVFLCGYITVFLTLGQLVLGVTTSEKLMADVIYYAEPIMLWGGVQPPAALISLALPNAFHLVKQAVKYGGSSLLSSRDPAAADRTRVEIPRSQAHTGRSSLLDQDAVEHEFDEDALKPTMRTHGFEDLELAEIREFRTVE